eukprot:scaffold116128_cov16-Tisochrysis_lutea.AAC.2
MLSTRTCSASSSLPSPPSRSLQQIPEGGRSNKAAIVLLHTAVLQEELNQSSPGAQTPHHTQSKMYS